MGGRVGLLGEPQGSLSKRGGRVGLLGERHCASLQNMGGRVGLLGELEASLSKVPGPGAR